MLNLLQNVIIITNCDKFTSKLDQVSRETLNG